MGEEAGADPLAGHEAAEGWRFVYDCDDDARGWVAGEFLLRGDGVLLRRMGSASYADGATTWTYGEWRTVEWWTAETPRDRAMRELKSRGYTLYPPGPVPIGERTAGPFPGVPHRPDPL